MATSIPTTQRAAVAIHYSQPLIINTGHPVTQPSSLAPGECLVKLDCTGVCHTDLGTTKGEYPVKDHLPRVPGHEGVGTVVAIGEHTMNKDVKVGDRVGLKWIAEACLRCELCRSGEESSCPNQKTHGYTMDGTFQEYCVSYVDHVTPIPKEIESADAVCILCAGLTVYKALKQTNTVMGNWVVISGAGGGLGHLAVQYAVAVGLRVIAIDTGDERKELALKLGAEKFIDFKEVVDLVTEVKVTTGGLGPHAAIITAASGPAYDQAVLYLRNAGTLIAVGMPPNTVSFSIPIIYIVAKSIRIIGSAVGNRQDAIEALDVAARAKVKCYYELADLNSINKIFENMEHGRCVGRTVVKF
ncbi:hypothetical protein JAAARDRAFT_56868 [Jaapia argillacea MUCL 33604]|uniref:alcohol dehydrogenase n=1 Tax=Jaapia argillacea MUCL 33604 TaxID=933084 RepID=A0A067QBJ9_9AGAM|nr:hypothetical protein JAAARDRAFT_56868 [Jaapia argillacea MUCL 33604]